MNDYIIKSNDMIREIAKDARGNNFLSDERDAYLIRILRDLDKKGVCGDILAKSNSFDEFFAGHLCVVAYVYVGVFGNDETDPVAASLIEWVNYSTQPDLALAA